MKSRCILILFISALILTLAIPVYAQKNLKKVHITVGTYVINITYPRFVAGIDIFGAQAIMNASYFLNLVLLPLSQWSQLVGKPYSDPG